MKATHPQVMVVVVNLSEEKMPKDEHIVLKVKGVNVNADIDARMDDHEGCVFFKRAGASAEVFNEWCENEVLCPCCCTLRRAYSPFEMLEENVCEADAFRVWVDSDMGHITRIVDKDVMEKNLSRGIMHAKIGAKCTAIVQTQDVHDGFKVKRALS